MQVFREALLMQNIQVNILHVRKASMTSCNVPCALLALNMTTTVLSLNFIFLASSLHVVK